MRRWPLLLTLVASAAPLLGAGPSPLVLPPATRGVHFDHARHETYGAAACIDCHPRGATSRRARDMLRPTMDACAACHEVPQANPLEPPEGEDCAVCHLDAGVMPPGPLADLPAALHFNHALHHERGSDCTVCHKRGTARVGLPLMRDCRACHDGLSASEACTTCHPASESGRLNTELPGGRLAPSGQTAGDDHRRNWVARHGNSALAEPARCQSCHEDHECLTCHAGSLKPQSIHGGNWATLHPVAARGRSQECAACHRTQSFCLPCHSRLGLAPDSPYNTDNLRIHPRDWASGGSGPVRHASSARRNPNACLTCHAQTDCIQCHGAQAAGFGGQNPHRHLSRGELERRYQLNRRPCQACHAGQYPEGFR